MKKTGFHLVIYFDEDKWMLIISIENQDVFVQDKFKKPQSLNGWFNQDQDQDYLIQGTNMLFIYP